MPIFRLAKKIFRCFSSIKKTVLFIKVHAGKKNLILFSPPPKKTLENLVFHVAKKHFPLPSVFCTLEKGIFAYLVI